MSELDLFFDRVARKRVDLEIDRILALLGEVEKKAEDEGVEELSPSAIEKLLKEEHERKQRGAGSWNRAFYEEMVPFIVDHENFKEKKETGEGGIFFKTLMGALIKRLGRDGATRYVDDLASFVLRHLDIYVRQAHGTGTKVVKEPIGAMSIRPSDENFNLMHEVGTRFVGKVVNEDPSRPFIYTVKVEGRDLKGKSYSMDTSASHLDLDEGHKYRMETTSHTGVGKIFVRVEGAQRHDVHVMLLTDQISKVLTNGIRDFLQTEYKEDIGKVEHAIKSLEGKVKKLDREIEGEGDEGKVEKLEKERDGYLGQLEELTKMGVPSAQKFVKEERVEHPFSRKMQKYPAYSDWYKYHSQVIEDIPVEAEAGQLEKVQHDLKGALEEMHGDYKGIPFGDLADLMMDAIYEVPDPSKKKGWTVKFEGKLTDYLKNKKVEGVEITKDDVPRIIKKVQQTLLGDERFKNLKQNLIRTKMRGVLKHAAVAEGVEDLRRSIDQIWAPANRAQMSAEYMMLETMKKTKDIPVSTWRFVVEKETIEKFRKLLGGEKLADALDIIVAIGHGVGMQDSLTNQLKKLFLTEVWSLEDEEAQKKVDLFNAYVRVFPAAEDLRMQRERDRVYNDIKDLIQRAIDFEHGHKGPDKRERKPKFDPEKILEEKPIEKIIKERDPDLIEELESIF